MADQSQDPVAGGRRPEERREDGVAGSSPATLMGVWERLRHHKVAQWTLAYAAGAYTLLHAVEMVSGALSWPHVLVRVVTLVLLLGLPIAATLAWFHGHRAQQHVGTTELAILTGLLALAGSVLWVAGHPPPEEASTMGATPAATSGAVPPAGSVVPANATIAVLPLVSLAVDPESTLFADGLSEELITLLARIPELRVTSRTSAFSFKGKNDDIRTVGEKLQVAHVLEGSVRRTGDRLRIVVRLIDARQDRQLWSETYDRHLSDFFAIQNEIATAVVGAMQVTLLGPLPAAKATRADAFALYLRAVNLARSRSPEGLKQAQLLLQQALSIDPEFAPAWNRLSIVYTDQADLGLMPRNEGYAQARAADEQGILADPRYAASYTGLGWIALSYDHNLVAAAQYLQRALDLEPNNVVALSDSAALLKTLGRLDRAIAIEEFNLLRDPLGPGRHNNLAASYYYAGRLDEAEALFRRVLELSPKYSEGHLRLGMVLLAKRAPEAALEIIDQEVNPAARLYGLAVAYHDLGDKQKSDNALGELIKEYPEEVEHIAQAHAQRGEIDAAFRALNRAYDEGEFGLRELRVDPRWASLKADKRWAKLVERAGLSDAQVASVRLDVPIHR